MIDMQEVANQYAKSYVDKTRIYFIEKYLSTFNASVGKLTPFNLFPRQKAFLKSLSENKASIAIKHRQAGITTITSAWAAAQMVFSPQESPETILCIGNKLDLSQQLIIKIRDFLLQVPRWYWGDDYYSPDPKSEKNKKDIFVRNSKSELELFNGSKVYARSSGPNAARGISAVSILIFDEAAFIEDGLAVYSSAVAATASVPNSKIVMVSTPNGKDELYYNTYKQALSKENNYNAVEFKWFQDLRYNKNLSWYKKNATSGELEWIIEDVLDSTGTVKYDEDKWRKYEQDGWIPTSPWYVDMCKSFNNDTMKIAQELDVSFMGSANNVVGPEFIEMQQTLNVRDPLDNMKDPLVEETWFWKKPIEGHRYICACIPEGESVMTNRGLVNVEKVQSDDLLVTKDGQYTSIKHRKYRDVTDEKIIKLKISNLCDYISFTWNHPIYASCNTKLKRNPKIDNNKRYWDWNFNFIDANDIQINDWVQMPNLYYNNEISSEDILSHWNYDITRVDFKIDNPLLNEDFWWFCGMWVAEGYVTIDRHQNMSVCTSHSINEIDYIDKIINLSKNVFGRNANITTNKEDNSVVVRISSKELATFLTTTFGKYAKHKYVSEWVKFLPEKLKIQFIKGYNNGDGFIEKNQKYCGFTSISEKLLKDIQDILFSLGIISSLKLHVKEGIYKLNFKNQERVCHCQDKYELSLGKYDTQLLVKMFGLESKVHLKNRRIIKDVVFSSDKKTIFFRVADKVIEHYTGRVYNYETESESHTFCCRGIATHNCDPSRGDAGDRTAIEMIDMDGVDENGFPIVEQVMEYLGKRTGDEIGQLVCNYAKIYNNAYVVVDSTGGVGDACLLTLIQLGYKNIYYEDSTQKTYTLQYASKPMFNNYQDKLPGFHFQGNRFPVLSNFAGMVKNNEIKIRSIRVINELETWIFKGDTGRMDHMSGAHDDSITCLAMGLFVMQFSVNKLQSAKSKDSAILSAYMIGGGMETRRENSSYSMQPSNKMPFYNNKTLNKVNVNGNFMWLFGK